VPDRFVYTTDDMLRALDDLLEARGGEWWDGFFADRPKPVPFFADRLRALWDRPPFSVQVLRQMRTTDGQEPCFGEDFLWALLATK
jgi:hypothetical protein